jgi:hypothetical protein
MGFNEKWISLIMKCCSSVKYRFKVNGNLTEEVIPSRGLRQGDPISPYFFLICAEAFSSMLNHAEQDGSLEGIGICPDAPSFNHHLFADDSRGKQSIQTILLLFSAKTHRGGIETG